MFKNDNAIATVNDGLNSGLENDSLDKFKRYVQQAWPERNWEHKQDKNKRAHHNHIYEDSGQWHMQGNRDFNIIFN